MFRSMIFSALLVTLGSSVLSTTPVLAQDAGIPAGFQLDHPDTLAGLATGMAGLVSGKPSKAEDDAQGSYWFNMAMKLGRNPRFRHEIAKAINARGGFLDRKINALLLKKEWATADIPRLNVVAPNLVRGGEPNEKGFAQLKSMGVTMVVNLRLEDDDEEPLVRKLGMTPVWLPIPDTSAPTKEQVAKLHELLSRPNEKIYVHCSAGIFRTGTMVATWRLKQGMAWDAVFTEMKSIGFDPEWLAADTEVEFLQAFAAGLANHGKR